MTNLEKSKLSLQGVAAGDAFGQRLFGTTMELHIKTRSLPEGQWPWTDDTAMAISIFEILRDHGEINQDALAHAFAQSYQQDKYRGYGPGAHLLLQKLNEGQSWQELSPGLFDGGSYGNGAAMRVAPLGAFFADDLQKVVSEAIKSAKVTHHHAEGQAGAVAVAIGAALASADKKYEPQEFIGLVEMYVPDSEVRAKITLSKNIRADKHQFAASFLGTGFKVSAQDTVPYCIWCAAHNLYDFEAAMWQTVAGFGDQDTTCAIVGGIVALSAKEIPQKIAQHVEPIPGF